MTAAAPRAARYASGGMVPYTTDTPTPAFSHTAPSCARAGAPVHVPGALCSGAPLRAGALAQSRRCKAALPWPGSLPRAQRVAATSPAPRDRRRPAPGGTPQGPAGHARRRARPAPQPAPRSPDGRSPRARAGRHLQDVRDAAAAARPAPGVLAEAAPAVLGLDRGADGVLRLAYPPLEAAADPAPRRSRGLGARSRRASPAPRAARLAAAAHPLASPVSSRRSDSGADSSGTSFSMACGASAC